MKPNDYMNESRMIWNDTRIGALQRYRELFALFRRARGRYTPLLPAGLLPRGFPDRYRREPRVRTANQCHVRRDRARKKNLVEYGFRLPAAMDNRPLKFEEFQQLARQVIYVSATPADYELQQSEGIVVEQVIRPTGLLDPIIEVRPSLNQVDDLMEEIQQRIEKDERILVTTLTKRMAEELTDYFMKHDIRTNYIHSDVDTLERVQIMDDLRAGRFDVLVGVNLLREGLDLPEVSLVAILDADKEGFLRSHRSLTQTVGRAARNVHGKAIMYADRITDSMQKPSTKPTVGAKSNLNTTKNMASLRNKSKKAGK